MSYPGIDVNEDEMVSVPRHMVKEAQTAKDTPPAYEEIMPAEVPAPIQKDGNRETRRKLGATRRGKSKNKELSCPSGDECLVRPIDMEDLMEAGLLSELDTFSKKLFPNKLDPAGRPVEEPEEEENDDNFWSIMQDNEKRETFMSMAEKIVCLGVVDPVVRPRDYDEEKLADGEISFGWITLNDKIYLFNYFMGPINAIASFR